MIEPIERQWLSALAQALRHVEPSHAHLVEQGWDKVPDDPATARQQADLIDIAIAADVVFEIRSPMAPRIFLVGMLAPETGSGRGWFRAEAILGAAAEALERRCVQREVVERPDLPASYTSGCAAAPTREQARCSALLELVERDALALWWLAGVPVLKIARDWRHETDLPLMRQDATHRRRTHIVGLRAFENIPVVVAMSANTDGSNVVFGHAAALSWADARQAALLELAQIEAGEPLLDQKIRHFDERALTSKEKLKLRRREMLHLDDTPILAAAVRVEEQASERDAALTDMAAAPRHLPTQTDLVEFIDLDRPGDPLAVVRAIAPELQPFPPLWETRRLDHARERHAGSPVGPVPLL